MTNWVQVHNLCSQVTPNGTHLLISDVKTNPSLQIDITEFDSAIKWTTKHTIFISIEVLFQCLIDFQTILTSTILFGSVWIPKIITPTYTCHSLDEPHSHMLDETIILVHDLFMGMFIHIYIYIYIYMFMIDKPWT